MYIFEYVNMPNVTAGYGRFSDLIAAFGHIHILLQTWNVITLSNIYKLCVKAEM